METVDKRWCVYIHTNILNHKRYIGQTCQKPEKRWKNGNGYKKNVHFYNAIQKYGWDNFEHEIVKDDLTHQEADELEKMLIKTLRTTNKDYGYNISTGGSNGTHAEDLTGQTFGNLTVLYRDVTDKHNETRWWCKCKCGSPKISVSASELKRGRARRCRECSDKLNNIHHMSNTKLFKIWTQMKIKSKKKNIPICKDWKDNFISFYKWSVENGYIEGKYFIHNESYDPSNCSWEEEFHNNAILYDYNGEQKTLKEISNIVNIPFSTLKNRLRKTGSLKDALTNELWDKSKKFTYNGETHSIKEWSVILNIKERRLRLWVVEKHLSIEQAINLNSKLNTREVV